MKREDVIKMAAALGWEYDEDEDQIFYRGEPCTSMLTVFARHVEQATLDRAAKVCKEQASIAAKEAMEDEEDGNEESSEECKARAWSFSVAAKLILELKGSHD